MGTQDLSGTARLFLFVLCLIAVAAYWPGLTGPFLLDDIPNLKRLGSAGAIENFESFKLFVLNGIAGPTGRPVALASFLIDSNDWPADARPFKRTNIILHILIGVILYFTLQRLIKSIGGSRNEAASIALIATALWLLNPLLVSTTLYVVQRMAQLAALFVIIGFYGYLSGRLLLRTRPRLGYLIMTVSVVFGTGLATLSKENGALLPLLIVITEYSLRHRWVGAPPDWRWSAIVLWVPSILILTYLALRLPGWNDLIPVRGWSLSERLMTQGRVLWDYLFHLFNPRIQTEGLYRDDIEPSRSLLHPPATLPGLFGLAALVVGAIAVRGIAPLVTLAILFFLGGHLIESTTLPLELHFEHRNYLPSLFLFLPVAAAIVVMGKRLRPVLALALVVVLVTSFTFATWQRATIWGDGELLFTVWAKNNPTSVRSQLSYYEVLAARGEAERAIAHLEAAARRNPDSSVLTAYYAAQRALSGSLELGEFQAIAKHMRSQKFDIQLPAGLRALVTGINSLGLVPEHSEIMIEFLDDWREEWGGIHVVREQSGYLKGLLLSGQNQSQRAVKYFRETLGYINTVEGGLNMVSVLARDGHLSEALVLLEETRLTLDTLPESSLRLPRATLTMEIEGLQNLIQKEIMSTEDPGTHTFLERPAPPR